MNAPRLYQLVHEKWQMNDGRLVTLTEAKTIIFGYNPDFLYELAQELTDNCINRDTDTQQFLFAVYPTSKTEFAEANDATLSQ